MVCLGTVALQLLIPYGLLDGRGAGSVVPGADAAVPPTLGNFITPPHAYCEAQTCERARGPRDYSEGQTQYGPPTRVQMRDNEHPEFEEDNIAAPGDVDEAIAGCKVEDTDDDHVHFRAISEVVGNDGMLHFGTFFNLNTGFPLTQI